MRVIGRKACLIGFLCGTAGFVSAAEPAPQPVLEPLRIEQFSPQGEVKGVRQVTVRFSAPVAALGDPRLPDPMTVKCPAAGKGRWADGRNWVYDFDEDLPAGARCGFTPDKALKGLDGARLRSHRVYSFSTGGPAITGSLPREGWVTLDEEQVFLLKLDAPATLDSIQMHASCLIDGVAERIPVEVLAGAARDAVLKERAALGYDYYQLLWKSGRVANARVRNRAFEKAEDQITVLRCLRRLPPSTEVRLNWGRGISTPSGIATSADQQLAFSVRAAFTAQVECTRSNPRSGCIPMQPINLNFTAPVPRALALGVRLRAADGTLYAPAPPSSAQAPTLEGVSFTGPFADNSMVTVLLPDRLLDDAGRPLENAARFPLEVRVAEYPALAKFSGTFGILEAREGGILPVTLRNLEPRLTARLSSLPAKMLRLGDDPAAVAAWLRRIEAVNEPSGEWVEPEKPAPGALKQKLEDQQDEAAGGYVNTRLWREQTGTTSVFEASDKVRTFSLDKPSGQKPAEVIGIPLKEPGFYVVELESRILGAALLGRDQTRYVNTAALVTNMAVHFKWGRESSTVWVTRLDSGAPIDAADVSVIDYCSGALLWTGRTGRDGLAAIDHSLGEPSGNAGCNPYSPPPRMVAVTKDGDFSFTQSGWAQGIDPYQFGVTVGSAYAQDIYHTVLDRPLFRAGEIVSMKHFLRHHQISGLSVLNGMPATRKLSLVHQGSGQRYDMQVAFGADGIAESEWKIPLEAKLGDYRILIADENSSERQSGRFKVEQFRLPSMRGSVIVPPQPLVRPKQVSLDVHVAYLSGGGAGGLPVKVRTVIEPQPMSFAGYEDYQFGGAPVKEGLVAGSGTPEDYDFEAGPAPESGKAQVMAVTLDAGGSARVTLGSLPSLDAPSRLTAEIEYADANGEILTSTGRIKLVPSALSVGIRREGWAASAEQMRFRVLALDLQGKPRADQPIAVSLYQSTSYSYRKRLIGGFYAYESSNETHRIAAACNGRTNAQGILLCEVAPGVSGEVLVRAEARDAQGQMAGATTSIWVAGKDDWWFGGTSGDRMDVLPEKKEYEAGETARFQVRMPFREATALVTVEREGVMSSFVTRLSGRAPAIDVPIGNNYAPNVYVSVLAVRGRVAHAQGKRSGGDAQEITALVDLNKPAYRLGLAKIKVGWKPHRLQVTVTPERSTFKVRDKARLQIHVARADGGLLPAGSEVSIAAVDEALLDLAPNPSWDLLSAMMGERGLDVWTSTAQMQVVGKRHYGRKAVPHGGGGGREADHAREQFDSLLLWKGRVTLDSQGNAGITVPLNDSLSSFRIVAVAHGGAQLFGSGSVSIATTQDLILLSGLPPLVREGDRYAATFTVRNTTQRALSIEATASVSPAAGESLAARRLDIPAGESRDLVWPMSVPIGSANAVWQVSVRDLNGTAGDKIKVTESVVPAFPVRTYQATIAQLSAPLTLPAQRPKGAVPGRGGLEITLRARLGDGLDGVREYMSGYPYICLEQQVSRGVALRDRAYFDAVVSRLPAYMDADGLLKYFPTDRLDGDDSLSAYVLAIAAEAGWPLPESDRQRIIQALQRFVTGKLIRRSALPTADLTIRKLAALDALSRYGAAEAGMLDSLSIDPNLWPTSAVIDWLGILSRVQGIAHAQERRDAALGILRSRLNFQGTIMTFSTERSDALWWLMISSDSNANRMLLAALPESAWREDIARLVRGALGRQQSGHWNTTVANAWGVLAMEKFSRAFESVPVSGATGIQYQSDKRVVNWPQPEGVAQLALPWAEGRANLGVAHIGKGKPWVMVRATAALPLDKPLFTGFKVTRTLTPVEPHRAGAYTRGDVIRVRLDLEAQSDMSWVVVDDPVPAGATVLGSGLGGQSELVQRNERREGWAWLAFEERRFDGYRGYYRFVPKGRWTVEYTVRLNNPGTFLLPATRVEAMYAPEMFGESPNAPVTVEPEHAPQ